MTVTHEVEHAFAVDETFRVPAFDALKGVASVGAMGVTRLDAVYYDTDDLRLARNQMTLRRREGGADAGWHLKLPGADGAHDEIGRPLDIVPAEDEWDARDAARPDLEAGAEQGLGFGGQARVVVPRVPEDLADLIAVWVRGAPLRPVARVSTVRRTWLLRDAQGHDLLEVADDQVQTRTMGRPLAGGGRVVASRWREIDVEVLDPAGERLLATADHLLLDAGARVAVGSSKLRRALAVDVGPPELEAMVATGTESGPGTAAGTATDPGRGGAGSAGQVVRTYLARHATALLAADPGVRLGTPESVHDLRVAARRLRSTIETFRPLLDGEQAGRIEAGLREIGEVLGRPRDAEVQHARLRRALAATPGEQVVGPVAARVQETLLGEVLRGRAEALAYLRGHRYYRFIDDLLAFVASVGTTDLARQPARRELPRLVRRADRRLTRRVRTARLAPPGTAQDVAYHRARKSAKRLRYACELMSPLVGRDARRLATRARRVQDQLGAHQDAVMAVARLRALAVASNHAGEPSFTYGLLTAQEQDRAAALRREVTRTWRKASRPGLRRWLRA